MGHIACIWELRNACRIYVKPEYEKTVWEILAQMGTTKIKIDLTQLV